MTDVVDLCGEEQRRLRSTGQLGARELIVASIKRSEALNPHLTAWVATRFDEALGEARDMEEPTGAAVLWGLPVAIKDLNDVAGLPTTYGSPLFADNKPAEDDDVTAAVRASGGIALGKTNVPEHGFGATTTSPLFGASGNPFDPGLSAGASTGGGAVAVLRRRTLAAAAVSELRNSRRFCILEHLSRRDPGGAVTGSGSWA